MISPIAPNTAINGRESAIAFLLPIVLLAPFMNRAYNIDEPMFIWVAQQITHHPLDFFGGAVDVGGQPLPMYRYNQNPPGFSYYLALFGVVGGWSEPILRVASMLAAGACGLGTYLLAARLCARPLLAATLATLTPGFLVSATTVMTDVGMTACYVWAARCWLRWIETDRLRPLCAAAAFIAVGALLKYYAISLVPLLAAYTLLQRRRPGPWIGALLAPVVVLGLFFCYGRWLYGINLLRAAADIAQTASIRQGDAPLYRKLVVTIFLGGCFAPMALCALRSFRVIPLMLWLGVVLASVLFSIDSFSLLQLLLGTTAQYDMSTRTQLGLMLAAGGVLIAVPLRDAWIRRDAESALLNLWVFGAIVFAVYVNHLINARVLLPLAPALAILVARGLPDTVGRGAQIIPLAFGAVLSLWVAWGDAAIAEGGRHAARLAVTRAAKENVPLYYAGLWGFQYYAMQGGARPFAAEGGGFGEEYKIKMPHGALLVVSSDNREKWRHPPERFEEVAFYSVANRVRVSTYHPVDQAGFYSHLSGILPYKFGLTSQEEYGLYRWLGPTYVSSSETK